MMPSVLHDNPVNGRPGAPVCWANPIYSPAVCVMTVAHASLYIGAVRHQQNFTTLGDCCE
jgi:hypothetical protein